MISFNRYIFKRFFIRKRIDNKNDSMIAVIFAMVIMVSTVLIILSSMEIFDLKRELTQFKSNEWNKIYNLYLGDCIDSDISKIEDYFNSSPSTQYYYRNRHYPDIVSIASAETQLEQVQIQMFYRQDSLLKNIISDNALLLDGPYIFIQEELMKQLNVDEDDLVLVKYSGGGIYEAALYVKKIQNTTNIKCFVFNDFLSNAIQNKPIQFRCKSWPDLVDHLNKMWLEWEWPPPYYIGYNNKLFGVISGENQKLTDLLLPVDFVLDGQKNSLLNDFTVSYETADTIYMLPLSNRNRSTNYAREPLVIYIEDLEKLMLQVPGDVQKLAGLQLLDRMDDINSFYLEVDFSANFDHISTNGRRCELQLALLEYDNPNIENLDPYPREYYIKEDRSHNSMILYYDHFDDLDQTREIMSTLDAANVRWNNARWKTIIDLNDSLKNSTQKLIILLIIIFTLIVLFLIIKFLLRLKLELHAIGVLKCFGYKSSLITQTYLMGYLVLILSGFFAGMIITYPIGLLMGYSNEVVSKFYSSTILLTNLGGFFISLTVTLLLIVYLYIYFLAQRKNIYELIKYEG